jgi:hypothetical protein
MKLYVLAPSIYFRSDIQIKCYRGPKDRTHVYYKKMKFYAGPKFLFSNMMNCHTFDVDIIMNTILLITNIITSDIPSMTQCILIVLMFQTTVYASKTHVYYKKMKFYAGPKFLFSNMMHCHTFDVDIIMNTILLITNIITSDIPSMTQCILIVLMFQTTVYASKTHVYCKK